MALGSHRPFDHYLASHDDQTVRAVDQQARATYLILDEFENWWFPRFRASGRRFLPIEQRDATLDAFSVAPSRLCGP